MVDSDTDMDRRQGPSSAHAPEPPKGHPHADPHPQDASPRNERTGDVPSGPHDSSEGEEEQQQLGFDEDEDEDDWDEDLEGDELGAVEDADWDLRGGDFTKAFNRARQADAALRRSGATEGNSAAPLRAARPFNSASVGTPAPAILPAMNLKQRQRRPPSVPPVSPAERTQLDELSHRLAVLGAAPKPPAPAPPGEAPHTFGYDASQSVGGALGRSAVPRKAGDGSGSGTGNTKKRKDKNDRATHQAVFDPRTLLILYKMIQSGLLGEVHGVVSTGKEANVYHAFEGPRDEKGQPIPVPVYGSVPLGGGRPGFKPKTSSAQGAPGYEPRTCDADGAAPKGLALKVYKTAQLSFKDRGIYTKGDTRFEHGYQGNNSRKMVSQWASKEDRNLRRLLAAGLRAPAVVEHRDNILVMEFLGNKNGWASPRLRDAEAQIDQEEEQKEQEEHEEHEKRLASQTSKEEKEVAEAEAEEEEHVPSRPSRWTELYAELLSMVRIMYQTCRLVHADLSEYNILYHENHLWMIDVSQSVQHDHASAFDFLRSDLEHVERYFARHGVPVLGLRKTFDFVISEPTSTGGTSSGKEKSTVMPGTDAQKSAKPRARGTQAGLAQHMGGHQGHEESLLDSLVAGAGDEVEPVSAAAGALSATGSEAVGLVSSRQQDETEPALIQHLLNLVREKQHKVLARHAASVHATQQLPAHAAGVKGENELNPGCAVSLPGTSAAESLMEGAGTGHVPIVRAGVKDPEPKPEPEPEEDPEMEDAVFKSTFIPRALDEVYDAERDADLVQAGQTDQLVYAKVVGLDVAVEAQKQKWDDEKNAQFYDRHGRKRQQERKDGTLPDARTRAHGGVVLEKKQDDYNGAEDAVLHASDEQGQDRVDANGDEKRTGKKENANANESEIESENESAASSGSEADGGEDRSSDTGTAKAPRGHRHEDRESKKERKQATKEAQREKRKAKMPKKDKKARVKKTAGSKR